MSRFQVHAVWLVDGPKVLRGEAVLAGSWPKGLRLSRFDGRVLTVVADVKARTADDARDLVAGRVVLAWQSLGGEALGAPDRVRVERRGPRDKVAAGRPGPAVPSGGPRRLRSGLPPPWHPEAGGPVTLHEGLWVVGPDELKWRPDDDPDDGGLAGVREPRRPGPGPGHLSAAARPPSPGPQTRFFTGPARP